jgi:hypothetical protein
MRWSQPENQLCRKSEAPAERLCSRRSGQDSESSAKCDCLGAALHTNHHTDVPRDFSPIQKNPSSHMTREAYEGARGSALH